ncbi:acylphosphatase [Ornithinibacillus sp. BX22]|uniref:Acylphosphatase n=2 Tax=Ornithinibacillus TaxID=484508 RepID=A0A923L3B5_9BACI|nr:MULTISPECIES: acylphosphatase [Ornithinibacillus]MBC5635697.1 acylphosphatase [Ornithinibacillus hominis]MBS3679308.1 acylphosphatase [Ornithinibacillus massiliensis]
MKEEQGISLPQLPNEIVVNAQKTRLDAFAIALEGWRRGLKLKWYTRDSEYFKDMIIFGVNPPGRLYSLSSDQRTHFFFRSRGDKVTNEAVEIGSEKDDTKIWLEKAGVPVPKGKGFNEDAQDEEIISYSKTIPYPLVIKPTNASLGNGVVTNIRSEKEFRKALTYIREELGYPEVIVEQHVEGKEYRVYVVDDKVIAAYNRVPANIKGDGVHTIEELIEMKNIERRKNARLKSCLIEIDKEILEFVQEAGYRMEDVPEKGKLIYLREKTNVSSGGDPIDVTDTMPVDIKKIAIDALKAIPGLYHGGVDIIVNEDRSIKDKAVVIELNPTAQIGGALFPLRGKARDIPAAIIDYYFPETKGIDTSNSNIYFDMSTVLEPLENRSAIEVEVAPAPNNNLFAKRYIVTGNVQRQSYHQWLKKQALERNLHGYVKNMVFDEIEVVVAGTDKSIVNEFKKVMGEYKHVHIVKVKEEIWNEPIMVGFDIAERFNTSNLKSVQYALRKLDKELKHMTKKKNRMEKDNNHILNSTSWKVMAPIRTVGKVIKKVVKNN